MKVTTDNAINAAHTSHVRQPTFGSLVSAIRRGDLDAASGAFDALQKLAPENPGWRRRDGFDEIGKALATGAIDEVQSALKAFQQDAITIGVEETDARRPEVPRLGSTIDFLA